MNINIIVALCNNNGIGFNNSLPWKFKRDMKYFSVMTKMKVNKYEKNAIIMGRKTWESIPKKPLSERFNIIISNTLNIDEENTKSFKNIEDSIQYCIDNDFNNLWVIGGVSIYKYFIDNKIVNYIYVTEIKEHYECDTFFPIIMDRSEDYILDTKYTMIERENNTNLIFKCYKSK